MAENQPTSAGDEKTGRQILRSRTGGAMFGSAAYERPLPGTYETYRKISADPTVALSMVVVKAPVLAGSWAFEAKEGTPDERVDFVKEQLESKRPLIVRECLRALELGWQPFEKVYAAEGGRLVLKKLKPLLPDITEVVVSDAGQFAGLKQDKVTLPPEKCFVYTNDREGDNWYGRSRHENVRKVWSQWEQVNDRAGKFFTKVSGVTVVIHYPPGKSLDASGAERDNFELAQSLGQSLEAGKPIYCPNLFALEATNDPRLAAELAGKGQWVIEYKDVGGASHATGFIEERRYLDSNKFRGWLRSERSGLEGQFGTKADAETHADSGILDGELIDQDIARCVNWYVVDDLLALNFGEEARGTVYITPAPLVDKKRAVIKQYLTSLLANPVASAAVIGAVDNDAVFDQLGLPKAAETVEVAPAAVPNAPADPNAAPGATAPATNPGSPKNDNADAPPVDADLLSTVGALNAVQEMQRKVYAGEVPVEAAVAYCRTMFKMEEAAAQSLFPDIAPTKFTEDEPPASPTNPTAEGAPTDQGDEPRTGSALGRLYAKAHKELEGTTT